MAWQVGDQLDRGDNEVQILYFLERLQKEAAAAGGALHILNGNHETMNVGGRFRYATTPGRIDFLRWQLVQSIGASMKVHGSMHQTQMNVCAHALDMHVYVNLMWRVFFLFPSMISHIISFISLCSSLNHDLAFSTGQVWVLRC